MAEIPEVIKTDIVKLKVGEEYHDIMWGFRHRYRGGNWRVAQMAFNKKSDAASWMKEKYLRFPGMEGEVIPVKRTLLLEEKGNVKTTIEEYTE